MSVLSEYNEASPAYVYHTTRRENVPSIREHGLRATSPKDVDTTEIIEMLEDLGHPDPFPFNRNEVTYCHVDGEYVASVIESEAHSPLAAVSEAVIVVDIRKVEAPMYIADMSIISDLIDARFGGNNAMMYADTPEEVIDLYQDSIVRVETPADVAAYDKAEDGHEELVIAGDVPPEAIAHVRL